MARHQKDHAGAVELDVVGGGGETECPLDAAVVRACVHFRHYLRASSRSSCARATALGVTPPLIIRASSRARSSVDVSSRTDTTLRPSRPGDFSTSRW